MHKTLTTLLACLLLATCGIGIARITGKPALPAPTKVENAPSGARKRIGLVAHDARKKELLAWVTRHADVISRQDIYCTGTTGRLVGETLAQALPDRKVSLTRFNSGPLGGDQQMGALIAQNGLDVLVFFVDPMTSHPHAADIQGLLRLCAVHNIALATTPATAEYILSSPLFVEAYDAGKTDYSTYTNRTLPAPAGNATK